MNGVVLLVGGLLLAAVIKPVSYTHLWDLPTEAVQSGLETLRSHLELVQGDAALLYEMV